MMTKTASQVEARNHYFLGKGMVLTDFDAAVCRQPRFSAFLREACCSVHHYPVAGGRSHGWQRYRYHGEFFARRQIHRKAA
jgi:hypothetical protein